ncbi:MAG: putative DNA binding domain-containing protein [Ignavibacteriae bacterium]|nr:putative DNA binding domain-containing protein [Ignavibacteriota bacterium]
MNYKTVQELIDEGEGFRIEFKRRISSPEKIARTIISFANTKGGTILFGVDDDGSIVGVESEKSEIDLIEMAGRDFTDPEIHPTINVLSFGRRDVIVCQIEESTMKPHYFLGEVQHSDESYRKNGENTRVYIRVNDNTMMASRETVKILEAERPDAPPLKLGIGENEHRLFKYLEEHERITVREYGRLINVSDRRASRLLVRLIRAGVVRIHTHEDREFFTLAYDVKV